ncbi:cobalamin-dependent protein [Pedococcus aerophilus]|uniref:Cobalamin-dependent protein n=1 Tax=Pedococcus aerophilus TaxID=436356 RepID=A0ABN3UIP2_9MICO
MYTISHAARLTGVPAATLRVWERRYGLVAPIRTDGGYRLYDERALQVVRAMSSLVAAGWAPKQAADHLLSDEGGVPPAQAPEPATDQEFDALARGAAALDPVAVSAAMDDAFSRGTFEDVVDSWLMPSLQVVGTWWRDGRVDVAGEHVVSATVHRHLGAAMEATPFRSSGPLLAVGLARGSHHELGVLAFSVVLRRRGARVVYLGTDLPAQDWVNVVRRRSPVAAVVGAPMRTDVIAVRETADALRANHAGFPVYVGGGAQDEVGHGTIALGHTIRDAADRLEVDLGLDLRR